MFCLELYVNGYEDAIADICTDDSRLDPFVIRFADDYVLKKGIYSPTDPRIIDLMEAINPKVEETTNNFIDDNATDEDVYLYVCRGFYNDFKDNVLCKVSLKLLDDNVTSLPENENCKRI